MICARLLICAVLVLASCQPATAFADSYLYTGAWSQHFGFEGKPNQTHHVLGLQVHGWTAAYFVNSYRREGAFAGYTLSRRYGDFDASLLVGAVYAYRGCYSDDKARTTVCPLVVPAISYTRFRLQPQVAIWGEALVVALRWEL